MLKKCSITTRSTEAYLNGEWRDWWDIPHIIENCRLPLLTECERDCNLVSAFKIILVIARLLLDCFSGFHQGNVSWYCETISDTKSYDGPWLYKWFMHLYAVVVPWVQLFSSWLRLWWRFSLITNCVFFHTLGRHCFAMSLNFAVSMVWLLVPWDNINDYIYLWFFPCYVACQ